MRNIIKKIICAALLMTSLVTYNAFAVANVIKINGTSAEIPTDMGRIRESSDRAFVPLRFVSEFLKNDVWYDDATKTAYVASGDRLIFVQNDNTTLFITSYSTGETRKIEMDAAAFIDASEERTYIPIRFLAEALDYTVGWDEETQTVTLDMIVE